MLRKSCHLVYTNPHDSLGVGAVYEISMHLDLKQYHHEIQFGAELSYVLTNSDKLHNLKTEQFSY